MTMLVFVFKNTRPLADADNMDDDAELIPTETYECLCTVADESRSSLYIVEHWFVERPERDMLAMLFDEAKETFALLYPEVEAVDNSVEVRRLRPKDNYRPSFQPAL
jgi:hypothetical protein